MNKSSNWISLYLYYEEPWDRFISTTINNYVNLLFKKKLISKFFFVRYWELGPHVRLRLKVENKADIINVTNMSMKYFSEFFRENPSIRRDLSFIDSNKLIDNNLVVERQYEPETENYGGKDFMDISESIFFSSSKAVISAIKANPKIDYSSKIGISILLNLGLLNRFNLSKSCIVDFCNFYFKHWLEVYDFPKGYSQTQKIKKVKIIFDQLTENQSKVMLNLLSEYWNKLQKNEYNDLKWLDNWLMEISNIYNIINKKSFQKLLIIPEWYKELYSISNLTYNKKLFFLFERHVHMTNNRLGIYTKDEPFIVYLINKILLNNGK
ncbi:MAG: hypothetical protein IT280_00020 [Ignavibacteria bacterium]|nr:hypothetical protein [Ignavibacteria bacterium]